MSVNPYAPPSHDGAGAPSRAAHAGDGGFALDTRDWQTVHSLTRWMRVVFWLQIVSVGVLAILVLIAASFDIWDSMVAQLKSGTTVMLGLLVGIIVYLMVGSIFLRRSAGQIQQGTVEGAPRMLGRGLRSLRVYLVIYALYELTGLGLNVYRAILGS